VAIELPEVDVRVVGDRVVIRPVLTGPSRTLVENAMIMTGEAVARYARAVGLTVPFATQEIAETEAPVVNPDSMASMYAARKLMKRSQHRLFAAPHNGLGLDAYVQSTSPLRRYLDLVVHQQLRAHLAGAEGAEDTRLLDEQEILSRIGALESVQGDIRTAEMLSDRHWTLVYLMQNSGWSGPGVVLEHKGRQTVVMLPQLGLETQMHLSDKPPPDARLQVAVSHIDLPALEARFRAVAAEGA
jgi:exoribonuclease-2